MLKRNSIIKFIFLGLIAVLGILLCVCPITLPNSTRTYNGFLYSIEKGIDIGGGTYAEYKCTLSESSTDDVEDVIDSSLYKVRGIFASEGYTELRVSRVGQDKIRVEASKAKETDYCFTYFDEGKQFSMTYEEASDSVNPTVVVSSTDIKSIKADYKYESSSYTYGLKVEFTKNGLTKLNELKTTAKNFSDKKIYVYVGDVNSANLFNVYDVSDVENGMFLTASSSSDYSSYSDFRKLAYQITSTTTGVNVELVSIGNISPRLGVNVQLLLQICMLVVIVASFVLLVVKYRDLGVLGALSMIFFTVLDLFLIQSITLITLNIAGIVAMALGYIVALVSHMVLFEKIKEEYAIGKKIHLSCKGGFRKALWPILDSHFILAITFVFMWIFLPASLKAFAIIMLVALLLSVVSTLALTRYFVNIYLKINSTKAKRLGLKRDAGVKEINEEVEIIPEDQVADSIVGGGNND